MKHLLSNRNSDEIASTRTLMNKMTWTRILSVSAFVPALFIACGGTVEGDPEEPDAATDAARVDGDARLPDGGRPDRQGPIDRDGSRPDGNPFVEPTCPFTPPPQTAYDCDVAKQTGCKPKEACTPFADYPSDPCEPETYGSLCIPAGTGTQGTACTGQLSCAAGYICVITGAGTNCAKYCDLTSPSGCTDGLVCDSVDVSGVGVCN